MLLTCAVFHLYNRCAKTAVVELTFFPLFFLYNALVGQTFYRCLEFSERILIPSAGCVVGEIHSRAFLFIAGLTRKMRWERKKEKKKCLGTLARKIY